MAAPSVRSAVKPNQPMMMAVTINGSSVSSPWKKIAVMWRIVRTKGESDSLGEIGADPSGGACDASWGVREVEVGSEATHPCYRADWKMFLRGRNIGYNVMPPAINR